jgi:peptidoglycan/LPS O-acetylase OafA/YrhL
VTDGVERLVAWRPVVAGEAVYRPELQGLRALAVVLVVVYHVWVGRVSGGVDVFFVITGFLATGQAVRAAERGRLSVRQRWLSSAARLVPAAAVVLLAVVVAGAYLLPQGHWTQTVREVVAAAFFVENWQLAADSVDYGARSNATSVVQHFWSLGVQGQALLLWPVLVAGVALSCRGRAELVRARTAVVLLAVFAASLSFSVALTASDQPFAYFHTLTRLWEFAAGGLLALVIDRVDVARPLRAVAGWLGVVGLVTCGVALQVDGVFPGWAALWPVSCAVLVLLAGRDTGRWGAGRILAGPLARRVGDHGFALYLWHWPVLILTLDATGAESVGFTTGALVVGGSAVLAVLTHQLVERRAGPWLADPRRRGRVCAAATATVLLAAASWQVATLVAAEPAGIVGSPSHPGALALAEGAADPAPLVPALVTATEDWNRIEHWDCTPMEGFPQDACARPRAADAPPPSRRIVVVGDSHAQQLSAALVPIAAENDWEIVDIIRGACPFSTVSETDPDDADCTAWLAAAYDTVLELRPDAVVTLASRDVRSGLTEQTPDGFVQQWRRLGDAGIPVLAIRDNPRFDRSVPECVERDGPDACGVDRADVYSPDPPWKSLADVPPSVSFVDIADAVCTADRCPGVIGNVLVYMDDNHLTATYSTSMSELLAPQVRAGLGF